MTLEVPELFLVLCRLHQCVANHVATYLTNNIRWFLFGWFLTYTFSPTPMMLGFFFFFLYLLLLFLLWYNQLGGSCTH